MDIEVLSISDMTPEVSRFSLYIISHTTTSLLTLIIRLGRCDGPGVLADAHEAGTVALAAHLVGSGLSLVQHSFHLLRPRLLHAQDQRCGLPALD